MDRSRTGPVVERPFLAGDPRPPTPWPEAGRRLAEAGAYWLATVRADGRPHVVPVFAVWLDGALYFVANAASRKARNLARDPHCIVTVERHPHHLVVEGTAAVVRDEAVLRRVAAAFGSGGWLVEIRDGAFEAEGAPTAGSSPYDVYEVVPTAAFGFGADDTVVPTRWRFSPSSAISGG